MAKRKAEAKTSTAWPGASLWKLEDVTPYSHNARTHPPAQVTFLAEMLKKFGPDQPIVVDEDGVILKGHGRRLAAIEAEMPTFPVVKRIGLSDADKRALRIADNQSALMSGWDNELVKFEIESLKRVGYDVTLLGFGDQQLVQFTTTPGPPGAFQTFDENIEIAHQCPRCGYKGSGDWSPEAAPEPKAPKNGKKK